MNGIRVGVLVPSNLSDQTPGKENVKRTPVKKRYQYSLRLGEFRGPAGGQESCLDLGVGRTDALCLALSNTENLLNGEHWNKFWSVYTGVDKEGRCDCCGGATTFGEVVIRMYLIRGGSADESEW